MSVSTSSPAYQCPTCKSDSERARNLAVFIDGTSNKPGVKSTNVWKLYQVASQEDDAESRQRTKYWDGIGGYDIGHLPRLGRVKKSIYRELEMALAWNVEKNVMNAYGWLAKNYRDGDRIYLFGFSRGAYQARALAAMIHEVGLLKEESREQVEKAYRYYRSINPIDPETRNTATEFKRMSCWSVRVHFVGVWDTVSSLGLIKKDVHITASASVTNACYFRHALALDERRVKFLPEYFTELNTHRIKVTTPRLMHSNVNEVWFAGRHPDVGGSRRERQEMVPHSTEEGPCLLRVGAMPLLWMKRAATDQGLLFKKAQFLWDPDEVDGCRREMDNMRLRWRFVELLPIRHQVSFTGTGKHKSRWHLFRPRSIIPQQQIHDSILSCEAYAPRATLGHGMKILTVPRITPDGMWTTEPFSEEATIRCLESLLRDRTTALEFQKILLRILESYNGPPLTRNNPQWYEDIILRERSHFHVFALAVIRDASSNFDNSPVLLKKARSSLVQIMNDPDEKRLHETLEVVQFSTGNEELQRRFIAHEDVIRSLLHALEWATESRSENLYPLAVGIVCHLINGQRHEVINLVTAWSLKKLSQLSLFLEVKLPSHLTASLKMIALLASYQPALCEASMPRIIDLAIRGTNLVASAAIEALVTLERLQEVNRNIPIRNILDYLSYSLSRLDAEIRTSNEDLGDLPLPPVLRVNGEGLDRSVMHKILQFIETGDVHQRTLATLTFLKLCKCSIIRESFCSQNNVLEIFAKQLDRRETSLLAAYALKTCLRHDMCTSRNFDFHRTAKRIVTMFSNGWFDDAVGQVEGCEIFRELMTSGSLNDLRKQVIAVGLVETIIDKFELGERHAVRMGLVCLDILEEGDSVDQKLENAVSKGLSYLRDERKRTQMKGVKMLSALALTIGGARALEPSVVDIVAMLYPRTYDSPVPRSQLFGPTAVLHNICKNEALRQRILDSREFDEFRRIRRNKALYPPGKST